MIVESLFKSILRGIKGLNKGLCTGLPKLDTVTFGLQRRWMTVFAADSGAGKTAAYLYMHIYQAFKQYCENPNLNIHFLLFSFEMSSEVLLAKLLSLHLYDTYNLVISYDKILSLSEHLSEEEYKYIEASKEWLEKFESLCEIIDKPVTAKGLYAICKEWSKKYGSYVEVERTDDYTKEDYIPNDPQQYLVVALDHIKLLAVSNGHTSKQEIDEACDYLIHFRNKCNFTIDIIQQLNRNFKSMDRRNSENAYIGLEDLSDSGGPSQAAETVIAIYHPFREKRSRCEGYDIRQLLDRARLIQIIKNRYGVSDKMEMVGFYGEIGYWKELPLPSEITDYELFTHL